MMLHSSFAVWDHQMLYFSGFDGGRDDSPHSGSGPGSSFTFRAWSALPMTTRSLELETVLYSRKMGWGLSTFFSIIPEEAPTPSILRTPTLRSDGQIPRLVV